LEIGNGSDFLPADSFTLTLLLFHIPNRRPTGAYDPSVEGPCEAVAEQTEHALKGVFNLLALEAVASTTALLEKRGKLQLLTDFSFSSSR
jgi:hypothetical protein